MTKNVYRPGIDGLRAIAVLSVVLFHLNAVILPGGYLGVDIFFVISGYLITTVIKNDLHNGVFGPGSFYIRRIKRIIPALYVLLLVVSIASVILLLPTDLKDYGRSLLSQSVFSSNIYFFFKSDYFDTPSLLKPILHTWSLSAEEQFYIIYPLLLLGLSKAFKGGVKYAILALLVVGIVTCHIIYAGDQSAAFYLLPARAWELLLGAVFTYEFIPVKRGKAASEVISILGLVLICYSIFFFSKETQLGGLSAMVPVMGTGLLLWASDGTFAGKALATGPLKFTGKISYSLYLWHWPLLVFYVYTIGVGVSLTGGIILFSAAYLLAFVSYRYIETPVRVKQVDRSKYLNYFLLTLAGALLFGATGYYFNRTNGLPKRFPLKVRQILAEAQPGREYVTRVFYRKGHTQAFDPCDTDQSKPAVLVWGDSHAGMIQPVLKILSDQYHQKIVLYSCPSALNVYLANYDRSYEASPCYRSNKDIINFIKENHITCVLFASAWSQYTEGRELKMEGAGQKDKLYADSLTKTFSLADAKRVFRSKMTYTVGLLSKLNVDIWIMEQVPQHQFWAPNEVAKRLIYRQDTTVIGRSIADHRRRQSFVNGVFEKLAKNKKVHLLDPTPYFTAGNGYVTVYRNGKCLYYDYNHLSPDGAYLLAPMFGPMFRSLATRITK